MKVTYEVTKKELKSKFLKSLLCLLDDTKTAIITLEINETVGVNNSFSTNETELAEKTSELFVQWSKSIDLKLDKEIAIQVLYQDFKRKHPEIDWSEFKTQKLGKYMSFYAESIGRKWTLIRRSNNKDIYKLCTI